MRKCLQVQEIKNYQEDLRKNNKRIGYVPTMGALHEGHQELIRTSQAANDITIVSIFVNRLQFNDHRDFELYPRTEDKDFDLLESMGVDAVFKPSEEEIYPIKPVFSFNLGSMGSTLEGQFRPGHFQGVCMVLSKFFHFVHPHNVYFGLKDLQQYLVVKRMVEDLSFNMRVNGVETKREDSGLAMSSRNLRLSHEGKSIASNIYKGLELAKPMILAKNKISDVMSDLMEFYEGIHGCTIEYCKIIDASTLDSFDRYEEIEEMAVCVAAYVEGVRLIDNLYLRLN